MVTRAQLLPERRPPPLDVPLQAPRRQLARPRQRDDAYVLAEGVGVLLLLLLLFLSLFK